MQRSGLPIRRYLPPMRDLFTCLRCSDAPLDLCEGVVSALLGGNPNPGFVCSLSPWSVMSSPLDALVLFALLFLFGGVAFSCRCFVLFPVSLCYSIGLGYGFLFLFLRVGI